MKTACLYVAILAMLIPHRDLTSCILAITGASCIEELDESEVEHYSRLHDNPLPINRCSKSRLVSSGLFTPYQAASIIDYRSRTGDILSLTELSLVDGLTQDRAAYLAPFITFSTSGTTGPARASAHKAIFRLSVREKEGTQSCTAVKYSADIQDRVKLNWAERNTYTRQAHTPGTMSMEYDSRCMAARFIIGDFSARFGQGLACWSGFSLSGYPTITSFRRNGSGITPSSSFSPSERGVATVATRGNCSISAALSAKGFRDRMEGRNVPVSMFPVANATWHGRTASLGFTATGEAVSLDLRAGTAGTSMFGEFAAVKGKPTALAGVIRTPSYGSSYGMNIRYNIEGHSGIAAGFQGRLTQATVDSDYRHDRSEIQFKTICTHSRKYAAGAFELTPSIRISQRWKPSDGDTGLRTDLRSEIEARWRELAIRSRLDILWCKRSSWLTYTEAGYESNGSRRCRISLWARWTLFKVDNWDDRIYAYERDVPGYFNVPAYYGRGWAASAAGGMKARHQQLNARLAWTTYPWTMPAKSSVLEFRIQYTLSITTTPSRVDARKRS